MRKWSGDAVAVYDEIVRRSGEAVEPALRKLAAEALAYKIRIMHNEEGEQCG